MPWPKGKRRVRKDAIEMVRPTAISANIYRRVVAKAKAQGVSIRAVIEGKLLEYLEESDD
jgi:predicted HicB family RNase H-like nuclease